jgi:hypothetical protein
MSDETYCVSTGLTLDTPAHQALYGVHLELRPVDVSRSDRTLGKQGGLASQAGCLLTSAIGVCCPDHHQEPIAQSFPSATSQFGP